MSHFSPRLPASLVVGLLLLAACAAPNDPTSEVTVVATQPAPESALSEGQLRLVLAPEGNEARYLVTEQLARLNLPTDAVGVTDDLTGQLVLNADGTIDPIQSFFTVDLSSLESDSARRDNFLRNNTLQTGTYPTAVFTPTEAIGLPWPPPADGPVSFQLSGDLTIRDVTRPVTWDFAGQVSGDALTGTAHTAFTFGEFELDQPRVPVVLSVEDNIRLELDLHLVKDS